MHLVTACIGAIETLCKATFQQATEAGKGRLFQYLLEVQRPAGRVNLKISKGTRHIQWPMVILHSSLLMGLADGHVYTFDLRAASGSKGIGKQLEPESSLQTSNRYTCF